MNVEKLKNTHKILNRSVLVGIAFIHILMFTILIYLCSPTDPYPRVIYLCIIAFLIAVITLLVNIIKFSIEQKILIRPISK